MRRTMLAAIMLGLALAGGEAQAAGGIVRKETWLYRGAEVTWASYLGWRQVVRYSAEHEAPVRSVYKGPVLFTGWRVGNRLYGRARLYRQGCQAPFAYRVRGTMSEDGKRAVLTGLAPVIEDCRIVDYRPVGPGAAMVLVRLD
jgi:hypothetical protein